jgi:hypothetical protein
MLRDARLILLGLKRVEYFAVGVDEPPSLAPLRTLTPVPRFVSILTGYYEGPII